MKYQFKIKDRFGLITHIQFSENADYQPEIPINWGYYHEGWRSEKEAIAEGLNTEESTEQRQVQRQNEEEVITEFYFPANYSIEKIDLENDQAHQQQLAINEMLRLGELPEKCSIEVYRLIAGWNVARGFTEQQVDEMTALFGPVMMALQDKRPDKAKRLIS